MKKLWAVLGSIVFFVIAPGTVVGLIPWLMTGWRIRTLLPGYAPVRIVGIALLIVGLVPLVESFGRALQGLGTPAPIAPSEKLVVGGFYRHVRNPVYVGVARRDPRTGAVVRGRAIAVVGRDRLARVPRLRPRL